MADSYILVDTADRWQQLVPLLKTLPRLAVDLEGDFELHRYGKHLCLLQISDGQTVWLIDPLALPDLTELWQVLENPGIDKILFGSTTDIRVLKLLAGCHLRGLVDLYEAGKYLELEHHNLPFLAKHFLDREFEKNNELQVSNWNLRPLSAQQLAYAADDVVFLLELWDRMKVKLTAKRKMKPFLTRMRAIEAMEYKSNPMPWLKARNVHLLVTDQMPMLKYLYLARDEAGRRLDIPAGKIIPSEQLVEFCRQPAEEPGLGPAPEFPGLIPEAQFLREIFWYAVKLGRLKV